MDVTRLEETLTSLDPSLHQMEEYDYMYGEMEKQKDVAVGKPLKEFELETPDGEMLKVSEVHNGNVLLIDFWASWYGVPSIPHTVLVDREGIIRGNRLHGEEVREAVESLL